MCYTNLLRIAYVLATSMSLAFAPQAFAENEPAPKSGVLQLVTGNDFKPWSDESLPEGGFMTDLVNEVYKSIHIETEMLYLPWKRGYLTAARGDYMATFPYWTTEQREKQFFLSKPLYKNKLRFFVRSGSELLKQPIENFNGKTFCLPTGYAILDAFKDYVTKSRRETVREMPHCFRMLHDKKVDFVVVNEAQGWLAAIETKIDPNEFEMYPTVLHELPIYFIVSKKWPDGEAEVAKFNDAFDEIVNNGTYQKLVDKHLSSLTNSYKPDITTIISAAKKSAK